MIRDLFYYRIFCILQKRYKSMYAIYLHKNKVNNRVYIGQTKYYNTPEKRWSDGSVYNNKIRKDLLVYNWEKDFIHRVLLIVSTKEEVNLYEKYYITFYQSIEYGYNILEGGECVPKFVRKDNVQKKPSYLKVINIVNNKILFCGSKYDVLEYVKKNIYPPIKPRLLQSCVRDNLLLYSELKEDEVFIIKKARKSTYNL